MKTVLRIYRDRAYRHNCNLSKFNRLISLAEDVCKQQFVTKDQLELYKDELCSSDIRDYDKSLMDAYNYARESIHELEKKLIEE